MSRTYLKSLTDRLSTALNEPDQRQRIIREFQQIIWHADDLPESEDVEVLRDLAYDFDLYEPDAKRRAEDLTLYGDDRLELEIREALGKLRGWQMLINKKLNE